MGALVFFYLAWCFTNMLIASERNRGAVAALTLSIFVTPLLVYLYLIATPIAPPRVVAVPKHLQAPEEESADRI